VLHGVRTYILQSKTGQIIETHSISAGLDYPGVGPEHAWLKDSGRAEYVVATDEEALRGFRILTQRNFLTRTRTLFDGFGFSSGIVTRNLARGSSCENDAKRSRYCCRTFFLFFSFVVIALLIHVRFFSVSFWTR
jgi:hypothetical protein